jgi:hypothetical protein
MSRLCFVAGAPWRVLKRVWVSLVAPERRADEAQQTREEGARDRARQRNEGEIVRVAATQQLTGRSNAALSWLSAPMSFPSRWRKLATTYALT